MTTAPHDRGAGLALIVVFAGVVTSMRSQKSPEQVKLENVKAAVDSPIVLVDARFRGRGCRQDTVFSYPNKGSLSLGSVLPPVRDKPSLTCDALAELAVFSRHHAAFLDIDFPWTSRGGKHAIRLSAPIKVNLRIRIVSDEAGPGQKDRNRVHPDVFKAEDLFVKNRVGVSFDTVITTVRPGSRDAAMIGNGCMRAQDLRRSTDLDLYTPSAMNVYYVPRIVMPEQVARDQVGFNCNADAAANIIYIATRKAAQTVLAHELGHALGLEHATDDFGARNLMRDDMDTTAWVLAREFRLGQVYHMNFASDAWLVTELVKKRAELVKTRASRRCKPKEPDDNPCPALLLPFFPPKPK